MKLQENLHWALGRNRKLASIGVYDLRHGRARRSSYTTEDPDQGRFVPLGTTDGVRAHAPRRSSRTPEGAAPIEHLLDGFARYPMLRDAAGQVLSMPPIINSEETKVHPGSRRLFIDVTGTGERIVQRALNILVTSLMENLPGVTGAFGRDRRGQSPMSQGARPDAILHTRSPPAAATIRVGAASN